MKFVSLSQAELVDRSPTTPLIPEGPFPTPLDEPREMASDTTPRIPLLILHCFICPIKYSTVIK